jgi:light-regulated signal transduction histidine kinase (bacteriophytochrome)
MRYGTQNNLEVWDMTDKELARLGRRELLELLIQQSKEMAQLQQELDEAKAQLARREIAIESCGTLAEAALKLSGIFEAADAAAAQYLENIKRHGEAEQ